VRWNDLFGDLEGQLAAAHDAEFATEVLELATAERASVALSERLAAAPGVTVVLHLVGGTVLRGAVADANPSWVLLHDSAREHLVPTGAIAAVEGAPDGSVPLREIERRLTLGHALRLVARDASPVLVETSGGEFRGKIGAVGADHCDVVLDSGRGALAVPFSALRRVTSA
jgi:sRNA-binding regulator protein Hfq